MYPRSTDNTKNTEILDSVPQYSRNKHLLVLFSKIVLPNVNVSTGTLLKIL